MIVKKIIRNPFPNIVINIHYPTLYIRTLVGLDELYFTEGNAASHE